ncbi:UDP-N-acetylmuramate dehydrogenase [Pseudomaricurvus alcaniphilus]|uniref:UDP-N-acetylmuramate dehydrogenase n=1 Tax=Pseudomaricurvus alcaniphilus TaxID=1166482 RepID=UPI00140B8CD4|nr:UDP-N-acetylmuramate dehydrogenase [Pseudomaricurvus alcaniphilus]NHN35929.1 UDP-N-acetylmuramate dehydrogenase [Pseudomaricurvus alcaniphilus]
MPPDSAPPPVSLLPHASLNFLNTMGVAAKADFMATAGSVAELQALLKWWRAEHRQSASPPPILPLGGGSNLILAADFAGLVIRIGIHGRELVREDEDFVWLRVGAGENWHQLVEHCLQAGYCGLENLALIPGNVGAAPIQNIGAYGVELQQVFAELSALEISSGVEVTFDRDACHFGYRDSIFKQGLQGRYIITSVTLKLAKKPRLVCEYPALQQYFEDHGSKAEHPEQIFAAVCAIRRSKLPDPSEVPNAGSFFQNPVVDRAAYEELKGRYPGLVGYPLDDGARVKLAAGWLIDHAGWRGYRLGPVGVHDKQALVLINPGRGSGRDVLELAARIQTDIQARYGVKLVIEPSVVGS